VKENVMVSDQIEREGAIEAARLEAEGLR